MATRNRSKYYRISHEKWAQVDENTIKRTDVSWHPRGLVLLTRETDSNIASLSWALCHDNDMFTKKRARLIASNRLKANPIKVDITDLVSVIDGIQQLPFDLHETASWLIEYENKVLNRKSIED